MPTLDVKEGMPDFLEASKPYTFYCDLVVGDYIKIVTGRNASDMKLSISGVQVFQKDEFDWHKIGSLVY